MAVGALSSYNSQLQGRDSRAGASALAPSVQKRFWHDGMTLAIRASRRLKERSRRGGEGKVDGVSFEEEKKVDRVEEGVDSGGSLL